MGNDSKRRVLGIGSAIVAMVAVVLVLGPLLTPPPPHPNHPQSTMMASPGPEIPAEADVFATDAASLAVEPGAVASHRTAGRSLEGFRAIRAYPGAPPHIPHELDSDEFRLTTCATCHERGGFVQRFAAYAPVTPHPKYENCLQCHAVEQTSGLFRGIDWVPAAWPAVGQAAMEGAPPAIPHDLQLRGNCLSCHGGPSAVREIRTTHPERVNCRQCHARPVEADAMAVFTRPLDNSSGNAGNEDGGGS